MIKPKIKPTVGRVVHYWPMLSERSIAGTQPMRADVCFVHHDNCVNLSISSETGRHFVRESVTLVDTGNSPQPGECSWMDYQVAQAAKHSLESQPMTNSMADVPGILTDAEMSVRMDAREFPRVTEASLEACIVNENYFVDETLTICVLKLRNGFKVVGESACVDPRNFDAAIGRTYARKNAVQRMWKLEGYALSERIRVAVETR